MEFNIADLFECVADTVPEREAAVAAARALHVRRARRAREPPRARPAPTSGVGPGDHVGCYLHNSIEHLEAMLACYKLRAVPINVNYRYSPTSSRTSSTTPTSSAVVHDAGRDRRATCVSAAWRSRRLRSTSIDAAYGRSTTRRGARPARDFGPARPTTTTSSTPAAPPGYPKGVVWRQEDIFFGGLGGGNPGGPPITAPETARGAVLDNPAAAAAPFLPPGDPGLTQFVSLALGPLMHASGQWSALGTLLGGGKVVLYDERARRHGARARPRRARARRTRCNVVGDASASPARSTRSTRTRADGTCRRCVLLGSGGSILSGDVKARSWPRSRPCSRSSKASARRSRPRRRVARHDTRRRTPRRSLTFAAKAETMVVDDDSAPGRAGIGHRRPARDTGRVPARLLQRPRAQRAHVRRDRRRAAGRCRATWRRSTPTAPCTCSAAARCASTPAARRCTRRRSRPC